VPKGRRQALTDYSRLCDLKSRKGPAYLFFGARPDEDSRRGFKGRDGPLRRWSHALRAFGEARPSGSVPANRSFDGFFLSADFNDLGIFLHVSSARKARRIGLA